jgi:peptidoglycan/LPS O-acetylase OafA/YrhL
MAYCNFARWRVLVFLALVLSFCFWAGAEVLIYGIPRWNSETRHSHPALFFLAGAVMATLVDLWVGNVDRANWRFVLIVTGVCIMGGAVLAVNSWKRRNSGNGWLETPMSEQVCRWS